MAKRATRIHLLPDASNQNEARAQLAKAGDFCIVIRERPRLVVMRCPDDCGDDLTLNVDGKAGAAWRLYRRRNAVTLYPSVWRTQGCESHFIIVRDKVVWANTPWERRKPPEDELRLVASAVSQTPVSYWALAERLDLLPWDVLDACRELCRRGVLREAEDEGKFRKIVSLTEEA